MHEMTINLNIKHRTELYDHRRKSWLWFCVAILIFLGIFIFLNSLLMVFRSLIASENEIFQIFLFLAAIALMHPALYISQKIVYKMGYKQLFFQRIFINFDEIKRIIAFILFTTLFSELFIWLYLAEWPVVTRVASWELWLSIFAPMMILIILQASAEEIVFRGFFQVYLKFLTSARWVYILIPSLIWALLHFDNFNRNGLSYMIVFSIYVLGVIFADWRDKTGSLAAPMILHIYNNFMVFMILGMDIEPFPTHLWRSEFNGYEINQQIIIVFSQTVIALVAYLLLCKYSLKPLKNEPVKNG